MGSGVIRDCGVVRLADDTFLRIATANEVMFSFGHLLFGIDRKPDQTFDTAFDRTGCEQDKNYCNQYKAVLLKISRNIY